MGLISRMRTGRFTRRLAGKRRQLDRRAVRGPQTALLEQRVPALDDAAIQLLIRDTDPHTLSLALSGASGAVIGRVLDNLPNRGQMMLISDIEEHAGKPAAVVAAAQRELLAALEG